MSEDEHTEDQGKETIYDEDGREELLEDGEIGAEEAAFMKGYEEADEESKDEEDDKDEEE